MVLVKLGSLVEETDVEEMLYWTIELLAIVLVEFV